MYTPSEPREKGTSVSDQNIPDQLRYTDEHEWVERVSDTRVRIGITEYAQSKLGDIVFVQLPDVGGETESGEPFGEVESPKSVSDLYAPLSGKVVEVNTALETSPELVNSDPYGEGWIVVLEIPDVDDLEAQLEQTLDSDGYSKITEG
ncbi:MULTISPECIES: glycine cleavage system protein GcvH [unclassified Dietzia]|uniref:glycine cleavage system protein GcvH n=1 Tax=unclassified Dietzia TaxID=2617939 RepID=UPI0015FC0CE2|nr:MULTISPECIES: glycine cleavage system protein GcvH [unclassified Dietzia]